MNNRLRLELKNKIRIRKKKVPACLVLTGSKPRNLIASSPFAIQNVPSPPDDNLVVFVEHPDEITKISAQILLKEIDQFRYTWLQGWGNHLEAQ